MAPIARRLMVASLLLAALFGLCAGGCTDTGKAGAAVAPIKIKGERFFLEVAADAGTRAKGLGGRTHIDPDGGMIFVFPGRELLQEFVMRDCPIDIDIIFTDRSGRVLATHAMTHEAPRGENEGKIGEDNYAYEVRLKRYSSKNPAAFAIELRGGTIERLGVKEGDRLEFDAAGLKAQAR